MLPAAALTPESVVEKVYQTHLSTPSLSETVKKCESCFTPGFLGIMERALANKPGGKKDFVDFDFFVDGQSGYVKYEVGKATISGKNATVPIRVWNDARGYKFETDPKRRDQMAERAHVHLTDIGQGFQITDIEFLARDVFGPDGNNFHTPAQSMRSILKKIADGH